MMIGCIQPKTFHVGFKRHFISLKRRMVLLINHGAVKDSTFSPGTVYLEEKTPSQHLSTSSDVSVKLEVEDLPLFDDRKPGPSQLFDSFEVSPSDMEVDSPGSFKKIADGNEDIKPNTYFGFREASI